MSEELPHIEIYTDGGADPNPGPGGWAAILIHPKKVSEFSGGEANTTNNRMELTAAIEALKRLKRSCEIDFYTDSEYLRKGITEWIEKWIESGRLERGDVANGDLWQDLYEQTLPHEITWHWVKGHAGNEYNERADQLAWAAIPRPETVHDPSLTHVYMRIAGPIKGKGPSGWAASVVRGDSIEILKGGHGDATANFFSLYAALEILQQLPQDELIVFYVNNSYLFNGITKWVSGWRKGGWQRPEKFRAEWQMLDKLNQERQIRWVLFKETEEPEPFKLLADAVKEARDSATHDW